MSDSTNKAPNQEPPVTDDVHTAELLRQEPTFETVARVVDPPLEITRSMLRLLNMVDETVIVHDPRS
jgi:hypothetical protein